MLISIIVAASKNNVIGHNNQLIWHLPADLKHFKALTSHHHIVMGRKTFESIGKPLPNRTNMIISRQKGLHIEGALCFDGIDKAIKTAFSAGEAELFIIGGEQIYKASLPKVDIIYLTRVHTEVSGDAFFPSLNENVWVRESIEHHAPDEKNTLAFDFIKYSRKK